MHLRSSLTTVLCGLSLVLAVMIVQGEKPEPPSLFSNGGPLGHLHAQAGGTTPQQFFDAEQSARGFSVPYSTFAFVLCKANPSQAAFPIDVVDTQVLGYKSSNEEMFRFLKLQNERGTDTKAVWNGTTWGSKPYLEHYDLTSNDFSITGGNFYYFLATKPAKDISLYFDCDEGGLYERKPTGERVRALSIPAPVSAPAPTPTPAPSPAVTTPSSTRTSASAAGASTSLRPAAPQEPSRSAPATTTVPATAPAPASTTDLRCGNGTCEVYECVKWNFRYFGSVDAPQLERTCNRTVNGSSCPNDCYPNGTCGNAICEAMERDRCPQDCSVRAL